MLTDVLVANAKFLVTSPEQLLYKRLCTRADLLQQYCKNIRKACAEFCDDIKVHLSHFY